jgi:hypothetical protein
MPEIARAVVLPDVGDHQPEDLLTLLLFWDTIEISWPVLPAINVAVQEFIDSLVEYGIASWFDVPRVASDPAIPEGAPNGTQTPAGRPGVEGIALADQIIDVFVASIRAVASDADGRGLAAVAMSPFPAAAISLPTKDPLAVRAEAALIQAAVQGVTVRSDTPVEEVVAFRERNTALMGRFRAAMIDLAHALNRDASPAAIAEEAHATMRNRVEPALGELETLLKRGRIRYAWRMLLGASSVVLAPVSPAIVAARGGRIATQALDYAFDRDKLVRLHPYGLLHKAGSTFGTDVRAIPPNRITDPIGELRKFLAEHAPGSGAPEIDDQ